MLNHPPGIKPPIVAGAQWFTALFALGFALGTVRVLVTAPALGETAGVLLEVPVMLAAGWWSCRWFMARHHVRAFRLVMALVFLGLLGLAETMLGLLAFGRSLGDQIAALGSLAGVIGFSAQLLTASFPLLQRPRRD